jgi:hypothetical protein
VAQLFPQITYATGDWTCISGESTWLLVRVAPSHPIVAECWPLISAGTEAENVLGVMLQAGFGVVSDFALVHTEGDALRVLVRGSATAEWSEPGASIATLTGEGSPTWREHRLNASGGTLTLQGDSVAGPDALPLREAVVLASRVTISPPQPVEDLALQDLIESPPVEALANLDVLAVLGTVDESPADLGQLPPTDVSVQDAVVDDPPVDGPPIEDELSDAVPIDVPAFDEVVEVVPVELSEQDDQAAEDAASNDYDHLFGATQHVSSLPVPPTAIATDAVEVEAELPEPVVAEEDVYRFAASPETLRPDDTLYPGRLDEPAALIDALPWSTESSSDDDQPAVREADVLPVQIGRSVVPDEPSAVTSDDDDLMDQTTTRPRLLGGETVDPRPTVLAARCEVGHLSPAHAASCRVCLQPLAPQEPVEMPRPTLGSLQFSSGDVVTLDRGVVMGRAPQSPVGDGRGRPHVMQLASPENDISRTHLEVSLDGWQVYIEDLGSTNGTEFTLPGQPAQQLRPHDPQLIEPGTAVTLADEVTFTFESET